MGAAAFWIALAAVLIAGSYFRLRKETLQHETIRQIVDKTGQVDEDKLKELFQPPVRFVPRPEHMIAPPGTGFRIMRVFGTLAVAVGAGVAIAFAILYHMGMEVDVSMMGFAWASIVGATGVGLFAASLFLPRPLPNGTGRKDRE